MAQRGATSIRAQFHNKPVELPPPPSLGVFTRWNGMVEWNGGMERWNGIVKWNGGIVE